jgi:SAM-dependent methyltransferase
MSVRPEERRTAREYSAWMRDRGLSGTGMRLLLGEAGAYLVNTPVFGVADEVGLRPNHRVLDLGCGRGALAKILARQAGLKREPVGVDISIEMLRLAARDSSPARPVELVSAAATRLPFAGESFHLVIAAYLFKHLEDDTLYRVLDEVHRILRPGGILLAWEFAPVASERLDRFHRRLLGSRVSTVNLRGFAHLAPYAVQTGYLHVDRLRFKLPFLFPPIPRVVVMLQKGM